MPVENKTSLVSQWHDRLIEAEAEEQVILSEQAEIQNLLDEVARNLKRHEALSKKEQAALETKLQELEHEATSLSTRHEAAIQQKAVAEKEYRVTLDAYEKLHAVVKAIKDDEHDLTHRPNLEQVLETESAQWSHDERRLRDDLTHNESLLRKQRKATESEKAALMARLAELEDEHQHEQEERSEDRAGWATYPKLPTAEAARASLGRKRPMADITNSM